MRHTHGRQSLPTVNRDRWLHECARRGVTSQQVAEKAGVADGTLYRALQGRGISQPMLVKLTRALASFPVIDGIDAILGPGPDGKVGKEGEAVAS